MGELGAKPDSAALWPWLSGLSFLFCFFPIDRGEVPMDE